MKTRLELNGNFKIKELKSIEEALEISKNIPELINTSEISFSNGFNKNYSRELSVSKNGDSKISYRITDCYGGWIWNSKIYNFNSRKKVLVQKKNI